MIPETVSGLPSHPLIVHAVVVLGPLSALGLIVIALVPRWRRPYGLLVAAGAIVADLSAFAAVSAGNALASTMEAQGEHGEAIHTHAELGRTVPWFLLAQAVLAVALVLADRRGMARNVLLALTVLGVVAGAAATVQVVRTGDSGSRAVWEEEHEHTE